MNVHVSLHEEDGELPSYPWTDRSLWLRCEDWTGTDWRLEGKWGEQLGSESPAWKAEDLIPGGGGESAEEGAELSTVSGGEGQMPQEKNLERMNA